MTPTWPDRVARTAASTPGSITPQIGMSKRCCRSLSATADAVLHATINRFGAAIVQKLADFKREIANHRRRLASIGHTRRVAQIEKILLRQFRAAALSERSGRRRLNQRPRSLLTFTRTCNQTRPSVVGEIVITPLQHNQQPVLKFHDVQQVNKKPGQPRKNA